VAGQTIDLYLIDPKDMDESGPVRTFSLVSAPYEPDLEFATRMRDSSFKQWLKAAPANAELTWDGPYGSFTLHKNASKPAVFLAGGIGITPFMSMIKQWAHDKLGHEIFLFHSNHTPEDAPFFQQLLELAHTNPKLHFIPTMTDMDTSSAEWNGERGFIDKAMLGRYLTNLSTPIYYIAGPPQMVAAMRTMLIEAGIDEDNIRFEEFPGY